jgi:hypothetical protein
MQDGRSNARSHRFILARVQILGLSFDRQPCIPGNKSTPSMHQMMRRLLLGCCRVPMLLDGAAESRAATIRRSNAGMV